MYYENSDNDRGFGFYCKTDEERIRELHRAGFRYIDLNMYNFTPESPYK
jgi:hypothetical protein